MTDETKQSLVEMSLRVAERFGVPVVLLAVGLWMLREAAISLHSTVVEPVVKSHVEFLESTQETLHEIGKTQDRQAQTLQELAAGQRDIQQVLARPAKTEGTN
jgi:transposase-like protein